MQTIRIKVDEATERVADQLKGDLAGAIKESLDGLQTALLEDAAKSAEELEKALAEKQAESIAPLLEEMRSLGARLTAVEGNLPDRLLASQMALDIKRIGTLESSVSDMTSKLDASTAQVTEALKGELATAIQNAIEKLRVAIIENAEIAGANLKKELVQTQVESIAQLQNDAQTLRDRLDTIEGKLPNKLQINKMAADIKQLVTLEGLAKDIASKLDEIKNLTTEVGVKLAILATDEVRSEIRSTAIGAKELLAVPGILAGLGNHVEGVLLRLDEAREQAESAHALLLLQRSELAQQRGELSELRRPWYLRWFGR